ncbi:MAG: right-handed parallel beta-helix repeat-containing protein [Bacteroidales bacterium]|nr:right-handed parallel beta-helix repeat-containing protein [Bacteroidales bacterium]MBN2763447.1 right-handed parallel beta-helix repeat-containing protein [Bacteroidales bacterium]
MKAIRFVNLSFPLFVIFLLPILISCEKKDDNDRDYVYFKDFTFEEPAVTGNTFYIDPATGSSDGNGSAEHPWRTLQEVIEGNLIECYRHSENYDAGSPLEVMNEGATVKGGDRLILRNGYHGFVNLNNFIFKDWLTIAAQEGHTPVLSRLKLEGAFEKVFLKSMTIIKDSYEGNENYWEADEINHNTNACLYLGSSDFWGKGSQVKLYGLTIKTTRDASAWIASDWIEKSASGIVLRSAEKVEIVNCTVENVRHGIIIEYFSDHCTAVNNSVNYYCADGSRIISNNVLFAHNTITGCLKVDDNHDDAIQSYTRGTDNTPGTGELSNVTIRGNLIIGIADKNHPLSGSPQGIGCFEGFFENWIVENNVIIVNHYHGISFYGMRNSKIVNNTVIDQVPGDDISPWIMITEHKSGARSSDCQVANNIVSSVVSVSGFDVTESNNYVFGKSHYDSIYNAFVNPGANDFHLLNNAFTQSTLINKGMIFNELLSSDMDKDMNSRNNQPDLGAYEASE